MINLSEKQQSKLVRLSEDKELVEALKILFLKEFLKDEARGVHELAASKIAIEKLGDAFGKLTNLAEKTKEEIEERNVV